MSLTVTAEVKGYKSLAAIQRLCKIRGWGQPVEQHGRHYVKIDSKGSNSLNNKIWFDVRVGTVACDGDYKELTRLIQDETLCEDYNLAITLLLAEQHGRTATYERLDSGVMEVRVTYDGPEDEPEINYEPEYA